MSIFKKVINAVKKIFGFPARRRRNISKRKVKVKKTYSAVSRKPPVKAKDIRVKSSSKSSRLSKVSKKKSIITKQSAPPKLTAMINSTKVSGLRVGEVTHYFDRIKVCVIRIDQGTIKKGDQLLIKGEEDGPGVTQLVASLQIENEDVALGKQGQLVGLKIRQTVAVKDGVFKMPKNG